MFQMLWLFPVVVLAFLVLTMILNFSILDFLIIMAVFVPALLIDLAWEYQMWKKHEKNKPK